MCHDSLTRSFVVLGALQVARLLRVTQSFKSHQSGRWDETFRGQSIIESRRVSLGPGSRHPFVTLTLNWRSQLPLPHRLPLMFHFLSSAHQVPLEIH